MPPDDDWTGEIGYGSTGEPDAETFRPPPHPDDRLWRHPSEAMAMHPAGSAMGRRRPAPAGPSRGKGRSTVIGRPARPRVSWTLMVLASAAGAAAAAGALTALGAREPTEERPATEDIAMAPDGSSGAEHTALGGSPSTGPDTSVTDPATVRVQGPDRAGSGLVLRREGVVLTGITVVQPVRGAVGEELGSEESGSDGSTSTVSVTLADGSQAEGDVVGVDELTGVAVLQLPDASTGDGYPQATLSEASRARSGMDVTVLGRLDDGATSVTTGVVTSSAWSPQDLRDFTLQGLLQIGVGSAGADGGSGAAGEPNEPAAPGGPVVGGDGTVVGMATTASSQGWVYAVPIDVAAKVTEDILETSAARHAWLGIRGRDAQGPAAGVLVTGLTPDGPARGRLEDSDLIVAANGVPVPDMASLQATLLLYRPGDDVVITYHRGDDAAAEAVEVTLAERPPDLE